MTDWLENLDRWLNMSAEEMQKHQIVLNANRVTRAVLAELFSLKESTIRASFPPPYVYGTRGAPTSYLITDIQKHLLDLNSTQKDLWSTQYLSAEDVSSILAENLSKPISMNMLVKRRKADKGPRWLYVTSRTIRYRVEDVQEYSFTWLQNREQCS